MTGESIALSESDRKEIDYTVHNLNAAFHAVLMQLDRSSAELKFPDPVDFNGVSLDSVSSKAAAKTVRDLVRQGQLLIAVEPVFTSPLSAVNQCSFQEGGTTKEGRFIGAFFP